jgi:hypothetical protein
LKREDCATDHCAYVVQFPKYLVESGNEFMPCSGLHGIIGIGHNRTSYVRLWLASVNALTAAANVDALAAANYTRGTIALKRVLNLQHGSLTSYC